MTDEELLQLVQSKMPEDLSPDEVASLRRGIVESESLRKALFETLQMESYLSAALGPHDGRAEQILRRANQMQNQGAQNWILTLSVVACTLVFVALGFFVLRTALLGEPTIIANGPEVVEEKRPETTEVSGKTKTEDTAQPAEIAVVPPAEKTNTPVAPPIESAPKPPEIKPEIETPWRAVLEMPAEKLPAFSDVCFQDFPYRAFLPRRDHLKLWFEPAPNEPLQFHEADTRKGKVGLIEGIAKLRAPLPSDGGFSFALENFNRLQIHLYHETQGVTLFYQEDQRSRWSAYATTRKPNTAKPETYLLTATDDDRARRAEIRFGGPLEIRYVGGEVLFMRGDIVLLRAPMAAKPTDIYFEGKVAFEGIRLVRTKDAPATEATPDALKKFRPSDLVWNEKIAEGGKLEKHEDGSLTVRSKDPKDHSNLFAPIPGLGFREVILELADVQPGAQVFLGQNENQIAMLLRFVQNERTKRLNLNYRGADDFSRGDMPNRGEQMEVSVGSNVWVKMLYGTGCFKWWTSVDGIHWASGEPTIWQLGNSINSFGIGTCRTPTDASITLKSVAVRELSAINSLADRELIEKAPANVGESTPEGWLAAVVRQCPVGVQVAAWRRACAIKSLGAGYGVLAPWLLESLIDDCEIDQLPVEQQLAIFREVMLVEVDPRDGNAWRTGYLTRIHNIGRRLAQQGQGEPFSSIRKMLMEAPTASQHALLVASEWSIDKEIIALLQSDRMAEALELCQTLRFFHFDEQRPIVPWAEATARRELGRTTAETARLRESWRPPLVEELNKEVYNFAADLKSVVASGALDDASRMIASLESDRSGGLAPSGSDHHLFVSLPVAVKLALLEHPDLRAQLSEKLSPLAQLRVRQAIATGDADAVDLAATQFEGTPSASEAHLWLGDRALQNGWFARALAEYRRADGSSSSAVARSLGQRERLAAAMIGLDAGKPVTETVSIGSMSLAASDFEALIAEMKARGAGNVVDTVSALQGRIADLATFTPTNRARLDGPVGQSPQDDGARFIQQWQIDYAGKQIATVVEGDVIYVSNRFQLAAYNATNGQRLWQTPNPPGEMRRGQDWALIPMKPLVTSSTIYVRQLYGKTNSLCAFEKGTGKLLWARMAADNESFASDPVFVQGQLLAVMLVSRGEREQQMRLTSLDPVSGDVLFQKRLAAIRESWQPRKCCEIAPLDDGLIVALGGATLCSDASGTVRWVRQSLQLPPEEQPQWIEQYFAPPQIFGRSVIVLEPGVEAIECLDVATGRLIWAYRNEKPRRVIGIGGDQVIVETDSGFIALSKKDGTLLWRANESSPRLTAAAIDDKRLLYFVKRGLQDKPKTPTAIWLDLQNGKPLGSAEFPVWQDADPRVGPLVLTKDRMFTFFSKERDANKDFVEIVPSGPVAPLAAIQVTDPWRRNLPPQLVQTLAEVAPGWQLISGYAREGVEKKSAWTGENDAVLVRARPGLPATVATLVTLPTGKNPRVVLRVGHEPNEPGKLEVRFGDQIVFSQERKADNANRWDTAEIHLGTFAGKQGVVSATYTALSGNDHAWWIKSLLIQE